MRVKVVPVVELDGANAAVTPAGKPPALKLAVPVKPLTGVISSASVAVWPAGKVTVDAAALKVNVGCGVTFNVNVVDALRVPDVPMILIVELPVGTPAGTNTIKLDPLEELAGEKALLTLAGSPATAKLTAPAKPPTAFTVTPSAAPESWARLKLAADVDNVKLGPAPDFGASVLIRPTPFGLPQPVTRS